MKFIPTKTGACACKECSTLCHGRPGWFAPGEATKAAAELGLSLKDFFNRYLTRDYWSGDEHTDGATVYVLSPAWNGNNGRTAGWGDPFERGRCALLGKSGCMLSLEARPAECRLTYGCAPSPRANVIREELVDLWALTPTELNDLERE